MPGLLYFFSYFHRIAPAVVAGDLMRAFAVPAATLGNLSAIYPYCFAAMALPGGSLADTLGPRLTLSLGAVTMGGGSILFGLAPGFGAAFAGRLLVGLGGSVMLIASLRLAAEWFRTDEFGTVSGWSQAVGSLGAVVGTTPLALLVEGMGWRQAFVLIGCISLLLAMLCFLLVRDRPSVMALPPISERPAGPAPSPRQVLAGIAKVAGSAHSWPPALASSGVYACFLAFVGLWGIPYFIQVHRLSRVDASNLVALSAVGLLLNAPLLGWLSDRLRRRWLPLVVVTALFVVAWGLLVVPATPLPLAWLGLACFLLGVGSGAVVLVIACLTELNAPEHVGIALGFHNLPVFLAFAVMQWLTGVVLDSRWDGALTDGTRVYSFPAYRAAFALCLTVSLAAFVSACLVKETRCRNIWRTT